MDDYIAHAIANGSTAARKDVPEEVGGRKVDTPVQGEKQQPQTGAGIEPRPSILNFATLNELFAYDPDTGIVTWLIDYGTAKAGDRAGSKRPSGYRPPRSRCELEG